MARQDTAGTDTATEPAKPLDVSLEDIGPGRKCLTIGVPPERISEKIESNFSKLMTDAAVPGFRKGRVPRRILERRFRTAVQDDACKQLVGECYSQAVEDNDLDVIGEPDIQDIDEIKLPESGPLSFKVEIEISPKVELPDLKGIKIDKPKLEVTDKDIEDEITNLRNRFGDMTPVEGGVVKEGDYVQADVRILAGDKAGKDGEEIAAHPDAWIAVHGKDKDFKGHVAGIVVEQLGKKLIGKKSGDEITISMTGPAGHEDEKIKDQPITIHVRVKTIQRQTPAEIDALLKAWGLESSEQLNERVGQVLKDRNERQQTSAMHEQVCDYLMEKIDLELPEGLTGRQTSRLLQRQAMELSYAGTDPAEIEQKIAELRQESQQQATKELKQFFILDQAAKTLEIDVSDAELNGRIATMAVQQGRRPEKLKQEMRKRGEIEYLFLQIREQKTLDKIIESAKVAEANAGKAKPETKAAATPKKSKKKASPKKSSPKKSPPKK